MSQTSHLTTGPVIEPDLIFGRLAVPALEDISRQLAVSVRLLNSEDLVSVFAIAARDIANEAGHDISATLIGVGHEALQRLRPTRTEAAWESLLHQRATVPRAPLERRTRAVAKLRRTLARLGNWAGLSRDAQLVFAIWLLVAALIAHSGPRDADVSLDMLAKRLRK